MTTDLPRRLRGLSEVMDDYDEVILDLWGVVHNGYRPFPGSLEALAALKAAGKTIALLSNAPRRSAEVAGQLAQMGVHPDAYDILLTSGEATHAALKKGLVSQWGQRCLTLGGADGLLAGTGALTVDDIDQADFILATGVPGGDVASNRALLARAAAQGLPFVCANPDRVVHVGDALYVCPGALADAYQAIGGTVVWFGKPHDGVYQTLFAQLPSRRILAVGDGMPTDVQGAVDAGIDVALVVAGIHRAALFGPDAEGAVIGPDTPLADSRLAALIAAEKVKPTFIIHGLAW